MADGGASPAARSQQNEHSTPTWVKVTGILVAVIGLALLVILLATGDHGPGRHLP